MALYGTVSYRYIILTKAGPQSNGVYYYIFPYYDKESILCSLGEFLS